MSINASAQRMFDSRFTLSFSCNGQKGMNNKRKELKIIIKIFSFANERNWNDDISWLNFIISARALKIANIYGNWDGDKQKNHRVTNEFKWRQKKKNISHTFRQEIATKIILAMFAEHERHFFSCCYITWMMRNFNKLLALKLHNAKILLCVSFAAVLSGKI